MAGNGSQGPTIRELIVSVKTDAQHLMKAQSELATTEIKGSSQAAAATGGLFAGAAVAGALGGLFLLLTIAWVLVALGLPTWAGFGIVTLLLIIVAAILGLVGRSQSRKIKGPELSKLEWNRTKQILSGQEPETLPAVRTTGAAPQRSER